MSQWIAAESECRIKFWLVCQLLAEPAQISSFNSLSVNNSFSAAIHLYMIRALKYLPVIFDEPVWCSSNNDSNESPIE